MSSRAEAAAEALEPIVPHYLNITQQYNLPTKQGQKFYTWAGKPGAAPQSRLGDYNVREIKKEDKKLVRIISGKDLDSNN